ncbi:MAG: radical SAM protein [Candidatus Pacebacteria bacterium]|nr:radical SAM protein [Candidatus Paceibacterota bacterium]
MVNQNDKFYFQQNFLFRKEHFGTLALMGDGRRYVFNNSYFAFLKCLHLTHSISKCMNFSDKKWRSFFNFLLEKKIIGLENKHARPRFIDNDFISYDCITFPRTVYWECTRNCNFNCIHCYSSSGGIRKGELSFKKVKDMIKELSAKGTEFLSIGGGEPFLYSHLVDVVKYAYKNSLSIEVSTNGSLVTDSLIKDLKEAGLKFIQVSLDGASDKCYSKIRKGGDLTKVIKNIEKLSKYFIVSTSMVVNKLNYHEIEDVIDLSIKLGVKFFRVIPFMEVGRASNTEGLQLKKSEFRKMYKLIIEKRKEVGNKIFIQLNENLVIPNRKNIEWMPNNHYGCSAGRTTCGIDSYGNVYPCSYMVFDELKCGNIKDMSLSEIWKNSLVMKKIRNINSLKGKCMECKYLTLCRGGCRAAAYLKNRNIEDSDSLCSIK